MGSCALLKRDCRMTPLSHASLSHGRFHSVTNPGRISHSTACHPRCIRGVIIDPFFRLRCQPYQVLILSSSLLPPEGLRVSPSDKAELLCAFLSLLSRRTSREASGLPL